MRSCTCIMYYVPSLLTLSLRLSTQLLYLCIYIYGSSFLFYCCFLSCLAFNSTTPFGTLSKAYTTTTSFTAALTFLHLLFKKPTHTHPIAMYIFPLSLLLKMTSPPLLLLQDEQNWSKVSRYRISTRGQNIISFKSNLLYLHLIWKQTKKRSVQK